MKGYWKYALNNAQVLKWFIPLSYLVGIYVCFDYDPYGGIGWMCLVTAIGLVYLIKTWFDYQKMK